MFIFSYRLQSHQGRQKICTSQRRKLKLKKVKGFGNCHTTGNAGVRVKSRSVHYTKLKKIRVLTCHCDLFGGQDNNSFFENSDEEHKKHGFYTYK